MGKIKNINAITNDGESLSIEEIKQKREEQLGKMAELELKRKFQTHFVRVYLAVRKEGKTVEQLIEEVDNKKSAFPRATRDFLKLFKPETIKRWIDELDNFEVKKKEDEEAKAVEPEKK